MTLLLKNLSQQVTGPILNLRYLTHRWHCLEGCTNFRIEHEQAESSREERLTDHRAQWSTDWMLRRTF